MLINIAIVLEMIAVNMTVIDVCSHRKYSLGVTAGVLTGFTLAVVGAFYAFLSRGTQFGNGNGLFVLAGFLYLIPINRLYEESCRRILTVVCTSWIYTMLVFCISVHLSSAADGREEFSRCVLIIQTALYALSVRGFVSLVRERFLFVLRNISQRLNNRLMLMSISWFFTVILIHLALLYYWYSLLRVTALLLLVANAVESYLLIYDLVKSFQRNAYLHDLAYFDGLTGLRNRVRLFLDADGFIGGGRTFWVIYLDLNDFKSVNDTHGHKAGDAYLRFFAQQTEKILAREGALYRMSGDEFICLYTGEGLQAFLSRLEKGFPSHIPYETQALPYLGCCCGYAQYPQDGASFENLLSLADARMYANKQELHREKKQN